MFGGRWISDGIYKAVLVDSPYGSGQWQLYNLSVDPGETKDLAKEDEERLENFKSGWDDYAKRVGVVFPPTGEDDHVGEDYHALEAQE